MYKLIESSIFIQHPSEETEDENAAESELNGHSEQNCLTNSDDALGQLSGEEDPWVVCTKNPKCVN